MKAAAPRPTPPGGAVQAAWPRLLTHPAWRNIASALLTIALLLLLAGWAMPELWRPAWAARRPLAFLLSGCGALLMWLRSRHLAEQQRRHRLSQLTRNSLAHYDFAPVTLPMDEPTADDLPAAFDEPTETTPSAIDDAAASDAPDRSGAAASTDDGAESTQRAAPTRWSRAVLGGIEWRRFEALCETLFQQDGYVTHSEPLGSDSGADIRLHSRLDLTQPVRIVQCRPWHAEAIAVPPVREFLGAMVDAGLTSGAFMTAGSFTAEAEAFARRHGITLVDGTSLLTLILRRPAARQQQLLAVATEDEYWRPCCPLCGSKMNRPAASGVQHGDWVCPGQPGCRGSLAWTAETAA